MLRSRLGLPLVMILSLAACAADEAPDDEAAAPAGPDSSSPAMRSGPLPEGVEALSLLGEELRAPTLPDSVLADRTGRLQRARAELDANPGDADAMIWVGRRLAYLGRYRDAIDVYGEGIELHPEDARFYRHRGHRYLTTRRFEDAVADLRRAAALREGLDDEVEPDGLPNALGVPTSTLHFNIWYHLGLAHYFRNEMEEALLAFNEALDASRHDDSVVAASYWLANIAGRLHLEQQQARILDAIDPDMGIIESTSYLDVLLLHKGERTLEEVAGPAGGEATLASTTTAYGVGNWHFIHGRTDSAMSAWESMMAARDQWAAFGFIAAEAELARAR